MPISKTLRSAALAAACATALATLAIAPPASAAPVFTDADTNVDPGSGAYTSSGACVTTAVTSPNTPVPVVENGPAVTATGSVTATSANGGDTATLAASTTATGSVKSVGGNPSALDFTASSSAGIDFALPASGCSLTSYAYVDLNFHFTVAQAGYMHFDFQNTGSTYSEVYVYKYPSVSVNPYYDHYGQRVKFRGHDEVFLPAGEYRGYFEGYIEAYGNTDQAEAGSTSVHATFNVAGSQTEAVSGKGKKYVTLPSVRSCATHAVSSSITGKKKAAKKIKQVTFFVNDAKVKKVKTPGKGDVVTLPVADDQAADVVAEVKLFPKKKGKPGKVVEVSASYEACS